MKPSTYQVAEQINSELRRLRVLADDGQGLRSELVNDLKRVVLIHDDYTRPIFGQADELLAALEACRPKEDADPWASVLHALRSFMVEPMTRILNLEDRIANLERMLENRVDTTAAVDKNRPI
jgi:hypothetical protein